MTAKPLFDRHQGSPELRHAGIPGPGFRMATGHAAVAVKRLEAGSAKILVQGADPVIGDDINRACDRKGGDWRSGCEGLKQHLAKGIGTRGEDEYIRPRIGTRQRAIFAVAGKGDLGEFLSQGGQCGTIAHNDLAAR